MLKLILILTMAPGIFSAGKSCRDFLKIYNTSINSVSLRRNYEKYLQSNGFILHKDDITYEEENINLIPPNENLHVDYLNTAAKIIADKNRKDLKKINEHASCIGRSKKELKSWPKYRAVSGRGNNLKNPHWGASGSPFGRFGPKSYDDGVHSIRKSISGSELPSPRQLVLDVLLKAEKTPLNSGENPNTMFNLFVLYITHDLAHQVPVEAFNSSQRIRCCTQKNQAVLSPSLSHSSCLPITLGENDEFYSKTGVRCFNFIRSELASEPSKIQYGEVMNKATAYMDHSLIYGTDEAETKSIRTMVDGKLNLGPKNILPQTRQGKYTKSTLRLREIPLSSLIGVMFSRNHNILAEDLKKINPSWKDKTLFQEARRINIAIFQKLILLGTVIESVASVSINETYNATYDASCTLEFTTAAYRFLHYFLQPHMKIMDENKNVENILLSDTMNRFDIIEDRFVDVLRGTLSQAANFGEYKEEVYQKFSKNKNGVGVDLIAIDIQRGRDHGLPTFLEVRRLCNLDDPKTFDDLLTFLPQSMVDLLKNVYESPEDIDLYVGGALESFTTVRKQLVGKTFGCIIGDQYRKTMGGDSYFFTHKTNPHPFTEEQKKTVGEYTINHLICTTSGFETIQKAWGYIESEKNIQVPCSLFKKLDLTPWKVNSEEKYSK